jgi:hypothetical protein
MKTRMYRYEAIPENGNTLNECGKVFAREAQYVIIAESEERARQILEENGENPIRFELSEIGAAKDELGRYFPESIRDARI